MSEILEGPFFGIVLTFLAFEFGGIRTSWGIFAIDVYKYS